MEIMEHEPDTFFDEDAAAKKFTALSLGDEGLPSESNGASSRTNGQGGEGGEGEVDNRRRLVPKGPRQLTSETRANYATARQHRRQAFSKHNKPINYFETCQSVGEDVAMADVETGGRRSGGGRGHHNPRKRRFRPGKLDSLRKEEI